MTWIGGSVTYTIASRGDLAGFGPIELGHGTARLPGEATVMIMFADLADLDDSDGSLRLDGGRCERRRALMDEFRRLQELIG